MPSTTLTLQSNRGQWWQTIQWDLQNIFITSQTSETSSFSVSLSSPQWSFSTIPSGTGSGSTSDGPLLLSYWASAPFRRARYTQTAMPRKAHILDQRNQLYSQTKGHLFWAAYSLFGHLGWYTDILPNSTLLLSLPFRQTFPQYMTLELCDSYKSCK